MFIYLSLLVCILGLLMYALTDPPTHPKFNVIGLHMFWVGLLAFLVTFQSHGLTVLSH